MVGSEEGMKCYNDHVETLRNEEYPQMKGSTYLDHAGTTPYCKSLVDRFAREMTSNLFGNPHSASLSSQLSTSHIEDSRLRVLSFFRADPTQFDVVFVANATAAIKLVSDAFRATPGGFGYLYHDACHTSLVGVREEARASLSFDNSDVARWVASGGPWDGTEQETLLTLLAYPGQSNMDGRKYPLSWSKSLREAWKPSSSRLRLYTLLDAAALAPTSQLDLSAAGDAPDFTVVSFYKIFGFPDLGALIVRRQAESIFDSRRYFGGGTVDMVVCAKEQWHARKRQFLHERLEDGTLPVHSIIALNVAFDVHRQLFGDMNSVSSHTSWLAERMYSRLKELRHRSGEPVCVVYSDDPRPRGDGLGSGPVVAFNLRNARGAWVSLVEFEKLAALKHFHIRTGGLCNPGGVASALHLEPWEVKRNFSAGYRCGMEDDIMNGKPTGVIRASLGAMSTVSDVDNFVDFVAEFYRDDAVRVDQVEAAIPPGSQGDLVVESITVYPIKSCGGFKLPLGVEWKVRPEGLAWDREWCLVHQGSGRVLSQKQHPRMALLRPWLDFEHGLLRVTCPGALGGNHPAQISVSVSGNPALFQTPEFLSPRASRVCGEDVSMLMYKSTDISAFFTGILGIPCTLARFPPGGQGKSMRHSKAHLQKHQKVGSVTGYSPPGSFPAPPSPPDSDSENGPRRILLSNESPILAINSASISALNAEVEKRGGSPVSAEVFRANVVIGSVQPMTEKDAYVEDNWSKLQIGQQEFKMLGSCRRCHMVCINQETAEKNEEPFVTLTKTRRFDGKVFFGNHMCHVRPDGPASRETQHPTIQIGDPVRAFV